MIWIQQFRKKIYWLGFVSLIVSILMLTQPLYMLNLYDRVLTSQSEPTLISITIITVIMIILLGFLDWSRTEIQEQIQKIFIETYQTKVNNLNFELTRNHQGGKDLVSAYETIKSFIVSESLIHLFDLIFMPIYFLALFLFHPLIGFVALLLCLILAYVNYNNAIHIKRMAGIANKTRSKAQNLIYSILESSGILNALGAKKVTISKFDELSGKKDQAELEILYIKEANKGFLKGAMQLIQILILAVACYLVLEKSVSVGVMFAANIIAGRALQPLMGISTALESIVEVQRSWVLLKPLVERDNSAVGSELRLLESHVQVRNLSVYLKSEDKKILQNINFDLDPSELLVVIGASGSGKSTTLKALAGEWPNYIGDIQLNGRDINSWQFNVGVSSIAYMPQDLIVFEGSILDNLTLFNDALLFEDVIRVSEKTGLHEIIKTLNQEYQTEIAPKNFGLSYGQQKLFSLTRALLTNSSLLVLDEPTAGLDLNLEREIIKLLLDLRKEGKSIICSSHSNELMSVSDKILWLKQGKLRGYGLTADVLGKLNAK